MHAFVEWPCVCRGTIIVRIGPEATHAPKPYLVSMTCTVKDGVATPTGFHRPACGFTLPMALAGRRALRREGLKLWGWERLAEDGELRQFELGANAAE